jgi:hypothetical protein
MADESKGGENDFIWALVAVFIILGILLAAAAWFPYYPEGVPEEERVIHSFDAGLLGYTENYVSRVQNYGDFGVGIPQDELLKSAPRMEISSGSFFGMFGRSVEEFDIIVPDYVIEWIKGGVITFTVEETNEYGNLMITWNGAELYNGKAYEGEHEIEISPSQMKNDNVLEVKAAGPGLMFWAATVYNIKDFEVNARYGPAKFLDFAVSQDELETLDKFELLWYTASRRGNLSVKVNGEELYVGYPERDMRITFTDADLGTVSIRPGNNRLTFAAINGTFELDDVIINTHVSRSQRVVREKFELTDPEAEKLKNKGAVLKIYVNKVDKSGRITVKLNEREAGTKECMEGWNAIPLSTDMLGPGSNWIEVASSGAFDTGEAKLEVAV